MQHPGTQHVPSCQPGSETPRVPPSRPSQSLKTQDWAFLLRAPTGRWSPLGSGWGRAVLPTLPRPCRDAPTPAGTGSISPGQECRFPPRAAAAAEQRCGASSWFPSLSPRSRNFPMGNR